MSSERPETRLRKKCTKLVLILHFSYFCTSLYGDSDLNFFFSLTQKSVREQICSEFEKITESLIPNLASS